MPQAKGKDLKKLRLKKQMKGVNVRSETVKSVEESVGSELPGLVGAASCGSRSRGKGGRRRAKRGGHSDLRPGPRETWHRGEKATWRPDAPS